MNEADAVRSYRRSAVLFDMYSMGAARDDWHNLGDAVHYTEPAYQRLSMHFFQQLLETGRVRALQHRENTSASARTDSLGHKT